MPLPAGDSQLVQIVDAALADAARRAGDWLACRVGCTQCCHGVFAINALDALRLREGMKALHAADPSNVEAIRVRARAWIAEYGSAFPGDLESGLLGDSNEERERFEEFANEAACPALDRITGRCDVYEWRPMTCRIFGPPVRTADDEGNEGLGHCELCFHGATSEQVAGCEMPVPHEAEAKLLDEMGAQMGAEGETVVALALVL
jgi:Fe-S-cluster containining protein